MRRPSTPIPLLLAAVVAAGVVRAAPDPAGLDFFETEIRPLLVKHCYECHSARAEKLKANLFLDSRAGWESGGDSGPAIIPGKPDESLLFQAVTHATGDLEMPPQQRLSEREVGVLREWIAMGAPDPRDGEVRRTRSGIDLEEGRKFWSFRPPVAPPVPEVGDRSWPANDIDRFILARLEAAGVEPADDAPRRMLLRRVHYDLTGLLPSPEELDAFLADDSPEALARVVDELLDRPEFGERWGRHWLDVARFAESSGGGRSLVFPEAWRFRDYVIDAFNRDKPYDEFVREQLAGDVLEHDSVVERNEQLVASGFLVLGPLNYELQDQELLEMEVVDEQIDTLGRAFLGMTLGCARCHDHMFDPIPTRDYYALAGIFQSTESLGSGSAASGVSSFASVQLEVPDRGELRALRASLDDLDGEIAILRERLRPGKEGSVELDQVPGLVIDAGEARITGSWKHSTSRGAWVGGGYLHDEGEAKGSGAVEFSADLPESRDYEVLVAYSAGGNRSRATPITIRHAGGETTVTIDQTRTPEIDGYLVSVGTFRFGPERPARVTIFNDGTTGVVIADAVSFADPDRARGGDRDAARREADAKRLEELEKRRKTFAKELDRLEPRAMAPRESAEPADGHVHIRGQVRNQGEKVPRGFLQVAMEPGASAEIAPGSSGRRELADWIASPEHPLTARVMVNRIWMHLLGQGIVRTPDNFGTTGAAPSHPQLLDHLAVRFVEDGWSVKALVREIVLSRSYRLSSVADPAADPRNELFGRAHRKKLDAESIRDTALLIAGRLDRTRGGSTLGNPGKYDLNHEFDTRRRSVYVPRFRNSILDIFEVFDAANPNLVVGKRPSTNLPTQALFLMNSPFIREQAGFAARRLLDEGAGIDDAYELFLCRPPTAAERTATEAFLAGFSPGEREEGWTQLCQSLFACLDFRFLH